MDSVLDARDVTTGFHPNGYKIDRTASAMNRYTRWDILPGNNWDNPRPVCFDSLPQTGWFAKDKFDWNEITIAEDVG